jgi:medium-chain acyl-[acyl-carrier-protein] hydrolase
MAAPMSNVKAAQNPWATCLKARVSPRLRLFCFPYVGGGTAIFRGWGDVLPPDIEVWAAQLPGRERRFAEPPIPSIVQLAERAVAGLRPLLDVPYAFFGHSMGALLSFEMARRLRQRPPVKLVVSAHSAPPLAREREQFRHRLSDAEFIEELKRLDGTPAEVLENPELVELVMPMLRADFEAVETYAYAPEPPLACPTVAYGGREDVNVPAEHMEAWRELTTGPFRLHMFAGGHFYLNTHRNELLAELQRDLAGS